MKKAQSNICELSTSPDPALNRGQDNSLGHLLQGLIVSLLSIRVVAFSWLATSGMLPVVGGWLVILSILLGTMSAQPGAEVASLSAHRVICRVARRKEEVRDGIIDEEIWASYSRYSSDGQRVESITDQQRKCQEYAGRDGMRIDPNFEYADSAVSGTKLHREGLDRMLADAAAGRFHVLCFHSLSRLARESVITMPMLKKLVYQHKVRIISVTEGVDSQRDGWEMVATILSLHHERYVKDLSDNVFRGQEGTVLAGYAVGDHCFGYASKPIPGTEGQRRGRGAKPRMAYEIDPETSNWVARIFHWFVVERQSLRWIARRLNKLGAPKDHRSTTPDWNHQYLPELLARKKYIGIWPWGEMQNVRNPLTGDIRQEERAEEETQKWVRQFPHLRIVSDELFQAAQQLLKENVEKYAATRRSDGRFEGSRPKASADSPRHLLSGLIRCENCGVTFYVGGANGKYLFCPNYAKGTCTCQTQLNRERAERLILKEISERILTDREWHRAIYEATLRAWKSHEAQAPGELAQAEKALAEVERRIARLLDSIEDGRSSPELKDRLAERRAEKQSLLRVVQAAKKAGETRRPVPTEAWVTEQLENLHQCLAGNDPSAAIALRKLVGGEIVVQEVKREERKRHFLRGQFTIRCRDLAGVVTNETVTKSNDELVDGADKGVEITLDFVEPDLFNDQAEEAKALYDEGLMNAQIAQRLGCARSYVTKLLKHWFESRGQTMPDGRSRRGHLEKKHLEPPLFQQIADPAKELYDQGLLLQDIATRLECDRNTITKAIDYWYSSRGLEAPDGRARRKTLDKD